MKFSTFDLYVVLKEFCCVQRSWLEVRSGPDGGRAIFGGKVIEHHNSLQQICYFVNARASFYAIDYIATCMFRKRGNPELGTDFKIAGQFSGSFEMSQ